MPEDTPFIPYHRIKKAKKFFEATSLTHCWFNLAKQGAWEKNNKTSYAQHIWELVFCRPFPDWYHLHHKCQDDACLNPWHLYPSRSPYEAERLNPRPVLRGDGKVYQSTLDAASDVGIASPCITIAAHGRTRLAAGFEWRYIDEFEIDALLEAHRKTGPYDAFMRTITVSKEVKIPY